MVNSSPLRIMYPRFTQVQVKYFGERVSGFAERTNYISWASLMYKWYYRSLQATLSDGEGLAGNVVRLTVSN